MNQLKKSYSLSDLSDNHERELEGSDEADIVITDPRLKRRKHSPRTPISTSSNLYFSELEIRPDALPKIPTADDISSGYSSGEALHTGQPKLQPREILVRTGSIGARTRPTRVTRSSGIPKSTDVSFFLYVYNVFIYNLGSETVVSESLVRTLFIYSKKNF